MKSLLAITVLLLLEVAAIVEVSEGRAGGYSRGAVPARRRLGPYYVGRHLERWQQADSWCQAAGLGGLMPADRGVGGDARRYLRPGECYWVRPTELRRQLSFEVPEAPDRCPCLRISGHYHLRLHRVSCRHRRRYLCSRANPVDETMITTKTNPSSAAATTVKPPAAKSKPHLQDIDDRFATHNDADDEEEEGGPDAHVIPGDEALDHAKFPVIALGPDGHPKGWLPAWAPSTARPVKSSQPPASQSPSSVPMIDENVDLGERGSTNDTAKTINTLQSLIRDQNSEFITLLVLYTIVSVSLVVLLTLCLVRCCRGYCGKAKIRYVKQVDADDIPRFMPSSWA